MGLPPGETLIQAPVPAQVIDKGIPTAGLLAHLMVAKFAAVSIGEDFRLGWSADCTLNVGPVGGVAKGFLKDCL